MMISPNNATSYWIAELKRKSGAHFRLNPNARWDVYGDVDLSNYGLCKIPIPLGNVTGRLILSNNCYSTLCENFPRNSSGQPGISFERCEWDGNPYLDESKIKTQWLIMYELSPELNVDLSDFA
jgi:hypothetical protein